MFNNNNRNCIFNPDRSTLNYIDVYLCERINYSKVLLNKYFIRECCPIERIKYLLNDLLI